MKVAVEVEGKPSQTVRARQLAAAFDVPPQDRETLRWDGELPIEDRDWNVGLIVGPSGSGKTTIARETFGLPKALRWKGDAVVDDFPETLSIEDVTAVCQAVGFNTIPAWLRPFKVLSNGEQFRVGLARTLIESKPDKPIVIDEFTSVVDRQVAKIGAHAAQKWVRKNDRQLIAVTCHYDVVDWLRPDWVLDPSSMTFGWEGLQRRPERPPLECAIARVPYAAWSLFAPFHYLTSDLHRAATCFVLFAGESQEPAAFAGVLHRPGSRKQKRQIKGLSRLVTQPDWQGLGLAFALADHVGAAYRGLGFHFHSYPAHPALIRSFDRSRVWELRHKPGTLITASQTGYEFQATHNTSKAGVVKRWRQGARPNAVFRFRGEAMERRRAQAFVKGEPDPTS